MKFTTTFITSFIAYTSFASAFPVATHHRRQDVNASQPQVGQLPKEPQVPAAPQVPPQECTPPVQQNSTMPGAVYFMTNDAKGNFVVVSAIGADGKITPTNAVYTGGKGGHGKPASGDAGPDPLFTQDSIKVGKNFLFAVNAGSNTLSMFKINELQPTEISMVGMPVDTQGEFPVAVAYSEKMNLACVVNGGAVDGVACFSVDENKGLVPAPNTNRALNLNQTTPATGPPNTVSDIIFSEDDTKLFVSIKGVPPTPGRISAFDVNPDCSLSETSVDSTPSQGGVVPFSMTNIPGKNAILNTDAAVGFAVYDFSKGAKVAANSTIIPIEGQGATCWSNFSPKTGTFFLTDIVTSTVTEVKVDDNLEGSIVKQYPLAAGSGTIDNAIATINGNDFLYVLSANTTSVDVMSLPAAGQAASLQTVDFAPLAAQIGLVVNKIDLQGMAVFVKQ